MSASGDTLGPLLLRTLDYIEGLQKTNLQLLSAVEGTNDSPVQQHRPESPCDAKAENEQPAGELEAARGLLAFLKRTIELSLEEGREGGAQGATQQLQAAGRIISLYDLLYALDNGQRLEEPSLKAPPRWAEVHEPPGRAVGGPAQGTPGPRNAPERAPVGEDVPAFDASGLGSEAPVLVPTAPGRTSETLGPAPEPTTTWEGIQETLDPLSDGEPQDRSGEAEAAGPAVEVAPLDGGGWGDQAVEVELIVSRFKNFHTMNRFTAAVRSLPGVTGTVLRHLDSGTLRLSVQCEGGVPLADLLRGLPDFVLTVQAPTPDRIEATLRDSNGLPEGSPDSSGISQDWGEEA